MNRVPPTCCNILQLSKHGAKTAHHKQHISCISPHLERSAATGDVGGMGERMEGVMGYDPGKSKW